MDINLKGQAKVLMSTGAGVGCAFQYLQIVNLAIRQMAFSKMPVSLKKFNDSFEFVECK